ncbi:DUF1552 domain-containing protein [Candidatus Rariloculus sp.]|uniref:DUF1552 domain-containing protein n=1 Tax=Candidatus Rariloculus sp. TaxID=3101265 RepID=UPI003D116FF9
MFITKKHIPRRTFLRGMGAGVALPLLDAMVPAMSATPAATTRYSFLHVPHGASPGYWVPQGVGKDWKLSPILAPLAPFKDQVTVISGTDHLMATSLTPEESAGDHSRTAAVFLSGAHPKRTEGQDIHGGITIDQVLAQKIGRETPLPSLELCIEDVGALGVCGVGYSCAYTNTISWSSPTSPLPMERNPQIVFERLFGDGSTPEERLARNHENLSILDSVIQDMGRLKRGLGPSDLARIDDYLQDIRELERRIALAENNAAIDAERPETAELPFHEHVQLMFDLQTLAFKADITRISTMMLSRDLSSTVYPQSGVPDAYHGLSHHQDDLERKERYAKINSYHVAVVASLLDRLRTSDDGDGTLLDHSVVLYGSPMGNSNAHDHIDLPVFIAGGGAGRYEGNLHIREPKGTPLTNLFVAMAAKEGIHYDSFGDSSDIMAV